MAYPRVIVKAAGRILRGPAAAALLGLLQSGPLRAQSDSGRFDWSRLPDIPDAVGFAGAFAGVSGDALLVAGGANFPEGTRPWTGGVKAWHDRIFVLDRPDGGWKPAGRLPRPLGYGVSLTHADEVICLGGGDATSHSADAFALRYRGGAVVRRPLPPLPQPLANACGAVLRDRVYLAGGTEAPGAAATAAVWSLPLADRDGRWERLPDIPGGPRMLAMAGAVDGRLLVCGGVRLERRPGDRELSRTYLSDAWAYTPGQGWRRVADLPHPLAAAPSPGYPAGQSHLLLFGGDDGRHAPYLDSLRDAHPGFGSEVLAYNTVTDRWSVMDRLPVDIRPDAAVNPGGSVWAPVTTPLVVWQDRVVIPGGEVRPAVRTPKVLAGVPRRPTGRFSATDWGVVLLYFLLVAGIGAYVTRRMQPDTGAYFLGGRRIPGWVAGLSIFGSKLSALTFIGIPAKAYGGDWVFAMNNVMILAVAPVVIRWYLPYFRKNRITSVYEFLETRFDGRVRRLGSLTFILFQLGRLGIVVYLPALVLSALTGIGIGICIGLTTVVCTAYAAAGGIEAVIWTELLQVAVLLGGAVACFVFIVLQHEGGIAGLVTQAAAAGKLRLADLGTSAAEPVLWVVVVGAFLTNLVTYSSDQVVVQRYLTTPTEVEARRSIWINALMALPATALFFGVGTALWAFYRSHPAAIDPHGRLDDVLPWYIAQELPTGLSGLVIAGLFAATMATIGSSMNAIATVATTDFYRPWRPDAGERESLRFARGLTLALGLAGSAIALWVAQLGDARVFDQYLKVIGLFGGALAGIFLTAILLPATRPRDVIAAFVLTCIGLWFVQRSPSIHFFLYPVFGVLGCVLVSFVSSRVGHPRPKPAATRRQALSQDPTDSLEPPRS
jgi:SSS family transporter